MDIIYTKIVQISRDGRNRLSPFYKMILNENDDKIYDDPATEAIINFRWQEANKNYFLFLFFRFLFVLY